MKERARELVAGGGVVALTGAGVSAEAGIPTFRDPGGLWDRFEPSRFGSWKGLGREAMERPDAVASFLGELRRVLARARPTDAHRALARLEDMGLVDGVITQNVDGLHQEAGSRRVLEIHGSFTQLVGVVCPHREEIDRRRFVEVLDRAIAGLRSAFVPSMASILPRCSADGAPMRPDFVGFGEALHGFEEAEALARTARVLLVVGTSGDVMPAASLPDTARAAGASVVEVGPGDATIHADVRLRGRAGEILPLLVPEEG
ncbi:MAG TPA: Sir2 family NAD-dependent protein deacetylase [Actinomycetota bacterium]